MVLGQRRRPEGEVDVGCCEDGGGLSPTDVDLFGAFLSYRLGVMCMNAHGTGLSCSEHCSTLIRNLKTVSVWIFPGMQCLMLTYLVWLRGAVWNVSYAHFLSLSLQLCRHHRHQPDASSSGQLVMTFVQPENGECFTHPRRTYV